MTDPRLERDIDPPLPRRPRKTLGESLALSVASDIRQGAYVSGEELPSEQQLAERYGVSKRAVRDGLQLLSSQGLIKTRQGKRALVTDLTPVAVESYFELAMEDDESAVGEVLELRLAVETRAAALAAVRRTPEQLSRMRAALQLLEDAKDDLDARLPADLEFHGALLAASGNRFFIAVAESLAAALASERIQAGRTADAGGIEHAESTRQHSTLFQAIESRDGAAAEEAMRAIIERSQSYVTKREPDLTPPRTGGA
jgi:GntR family transcriptional repressor for pyruvate dehydrogenase complex